ncbi:MAG: helix-turn-helix domain-containing protein [Potamolinea sp.]
MVKQAFKCKGWTQDYLAGSVGCTRQTVSKFFSGKEIDKEIFQNICRELSLNWKDIVDWDIEEPANKGLGISSRETCDAMDRLTTPADKTEDQKKSEARVAYAIAGTAAKVDLPQINAIIALLQKKTGDFSIEIVDIAEGSVRLILEGSQSGLEQIETLFKSGQLTEVLGIPVLDARFITMKRNKKILVFTIDANISTADLQIVKAVLSNGDFRDAKPGYIDTSGISIAANIGQADFNSAINRSGNTEPMK